MSVHSSLKSCAIRRAIPTEICKVFQSVSTSSMHCLRVHPLPSDYPCLMTSRRVPSSTKPLVKGATQRLSPTTKKRCSKRTCTLSNVAPASSGPDIDLAFATKYLWAASLEPNFATSDGVLPAETASIAIRRKGEMDEGSLAMALRKEPRCRKPT